MKFFMLSLATAAFAITAGCNIFPARDTQSVHFYDLGDPVVKSKLKTHVELSSVDAVFSEKTQMVFRNGANSVLFDEFNRWSDLPSALLRRYFITYLDKAGKSEKTTNRSAATFGLKLEIIRFDCDLKKKTSNIEVRFQLINPTSGKIASQGILSAAAPASSETAVGYAEAMSTALADLARTLTSRINAMK